MGRRSIDGAFVRMTLANTAFFVGQALLILLPVRLRELGADHRAIGFYVGIQGVASLLTMPLVGVLSDRHGTRRYLVAGYVVLVGALLGYQGLDDVGWRLGLVRFAGGVSAAAIWVGGSIYVARTAPPGALARRVGLFGVATLVTHAIGPPLGEVVVARFGWDALFAVAAGATLFGLAIVAGVASPPRAAVAGPDVSLLAVLRRGRGAYGVTLLAALGWGAVFTLLPAKVADAGGVVAPFFTAYAAAALAVRALAGGLSDRVGRKRVAIPALIGFALAVAGASVATAPPGLVAIGLLFGTCHGVHYPAIAAMALETMPATARGRAMALFNMMFNLGASLGALGYGALADAIGVRHVFVAAGAVALAAPAVLAATRAGPRAGDG
jgi:MFS family permease